MKLGTGVLVLITLLVSLLATSTGAGAQEKGPPEDRGLGRYGRSGEIKRSDLPPGVAERASDRALEAAQSAAFSEARSNWDEEEDFVWQVHRQLKTREKLDYMSADPNHVGQVMRDKKGGMRHINLHMTDEESEEFERRLALGDKIPELERLLGVEQSEEEGVDPVYGPNFGGIWQDQTDGGRLVVALVDPSKAVPELAAVVGGADNIKIIRVQLSFNELLETRDAIGQALIAADVPNSIRIESGSSGKQIVVQAPDVKLARATVRTTGLQRFVSFVEGSPLTEDSGTHDQHSEYHQQPGLRIAQQGGFCTWGVNGHTSSLNYITTAAHCFKYNKNYSGWATNTNILQGNFDLTPGSQYLKTKHGNGRDAGRMSSPQADSNCYHAGADCRRFIERRAQHNSWEINSDWVCISMGNTNLYDCGTVQEENVGSWFDGCKASSMVRYDIDTSPGDSGSGVIGTRAGDGATIDAIHACGDGTSGKGNTAWHVKEALGFDYNCATSRVRNRSAGDWGACLNVNR